MFKNYPVYIVILLIFLYVFIPFLAPVFFKLGYSNIGTSINRIYEPFCHQRVERSIFIFSNKGLIKQYPIKELKELNYLPSTPADTNVWPEYYGHGYYGNNEIGFKVPLCIRDLALYLGLVIASLIIVIYSEKNKKRLVVPFTILLIFFLPMMVDGFTETLIEFFKLRFIPMWFIDDWFRRIVTGCMFGVGIALYIIPAFYWDYDNRKKTKSEETN